MCTIQFIPDTNKVVEDPNSYTGYARDAEIMTFEKYRDILTKFIPYKDYIKYISLHVVESLFLIKHLLIKLNLREIQDFRMWALPLIATF